MTVRKLTPFEAPIAKAVVDLGAVRHWEFSAFLESDKGPLIELRTLCKYDGCDPSEDVHRQAKNGKLIVVHHNHLSQESLSSPDWMGLANLFHETWAHCADGTVYWGRVTKHCEVKRIIGSAIDETAIETMICNILCPKYNQQGVHLAGFFRKEIINRAMKICGFVEYEYEWGLGGNILQFLQTSTIGHCAGYWGRKLEPEINQAAKQLARCL